MSEWGIRSLGGLRQYWSLFQRIRKLARRERVTAIHCGRCLPEGWIALMLKKLCGIPYVCFVHGEDVESASTSRELSWMVHRILSGADFLIANSQNTATLLSDNWNLPGNRVHVVHPGVDSSRFVPADRDENVRRDLNWHDRTVVLTVGRMQKRKGHDVMIRALPTIREVVPDVLYSVVGNGEERAAIEKLVQVVGVADHVQLLDEVDDATMIRCYQQCDLFALPNRTVGRDIEGFGMVLVEAQSCGRPVLAGASGGTRETMRPGETGIVTPCEDPEVLAAKVIRLLLDREALSVMGKAARPWVVEHLDWNALTKQLGDLVGIPYEPAQTASRPQEVTAQ